MKSTEQAVAHQRAISSAITFQPPSQSRPWADFRRSAESNMIGELNEFYGWLRAGTAGWRFLFIPSYRREMMSGWRFERWYYVALDIVCGLAGIALSLLIAFALIYILADLNTQ